MYPGHERDMLLLRAIFLCIHFMLCAVASPVASVVNDITLLNSSSHLANLTDRTSIAPAQCAQSPGITHLNNWPYSGPRPTPFKVPLDVAEDSISIVTRQSSDGYSTNIQHLEDDPSLGSAPCLELKQARISVPASENGGFLRLRTVPMPLADSDYWLIWAFSTPVVLRAYVRNPETRLLEMETLESTGGPSTSAKRWRGREGLEVFVDVSASPQGAEGEIAIWQFLNRNNGTAS